MRFSVQHGIADPAWTPAILGPAAVTRFAEVAERSGYHAIGFTDHPAPTTRWLEHGGEGSAEVFTSLGFCAAVTSTIRLLTFVLVLPYRPSLLSAHAIATLDVLSEGRVTVGIGAGYLGGELRALGSAVEGRSQKTELAVDTLRTALAGDAVPTGERGTVRVGPPVVQRPHPPLWFHGNGRFGTELAARHGAGWLVIMARDDLARVIRTPPIGDTTVLRRRMDGLRDETERAGRRRDEVEVVVANRWPMLDIRRGWDAARLREEAAGLEDVGVDEVVVAVCGDDPGAAAETLQGFADDVMAG